jgi:hypothetical protein
MKIEGYQGSNVNLNTVSATVKRVSDAMAYGGDGSGLKAIGQAANQWAAVIQKQQDEEDRQAVLQAMDAYNKGRYNIMYNDDNGLMNTVAEGSNGISQSYIDQEKELRDGVMKGIKLHSRRNAVALENLMNKSAQQGFQQVDQHQYRQGEAVKDLRLNNNLLNEMEYVQKNPLSIQESFDRYALMVGARYSGMKGGPELTEAKIREAQGQLVGAAIGAAMQQGDTVTAQQITAAYGHFLTPQQRSSYGAAIQKNVEIKEQMAAAQRLYDQYGDDMAAVRSAIDGMNFNGVEPQAEGTSWVKNSGVSLAGIQENTKNGLNFVAKTFSDMGGGQLVVTSGTDSTDIHAAGTRSHGGGWKLDVAADWLENEDNRKAYINQLESQGIKVIDEYSNPSPNSTGGHLDLDFTDYTGSSGMDSLQAYKKREGVWEAYANKVSAAQRMEKLQLYKLGNDFSKEVYQWLQNGNVSYDQALAEALKRAGSDRKALGVYVDAVNDWYKAYGQSGTATGGSRNSKTSSEASLRIKKAQYMLSNGQFNSADEYVGWISNIPGVSGKDVWDARQEFSEWYEHKGKYKYDLDADFKNTVLGNLKEKERNRLWPGVKLYMYQAISDFMIANKREPSRVEVEAMGQKALTQEKFGQYDSRGFNVFSYPDLTFSRAELARMNIREIKNVSTGEGNDFYQVYFTDGRPPQYMFGEQLKKMNEGILPISVVDYGLPEGE